MDLDLDFVGFHSLANCAAGMVVVVAVIFLIMLWYNYIFVCFSVGGGGVHGVVFVCMVHLLHYVDTCLYCRCRITSSFSVYKNTKWAMEWMTSDLQR